ncbi:AfsA-related hotdog domain-containing protein [Pseudomonas frederiksbergensis]|uniref:AfsA-related hotdog domain-containing protein n=1 Tax=Pseudomonas frederiksbergensis TaxID=104087 RepID=UPI00101AE45C|nr:AfsA-related hotdog domain-containing protein [Pseudomonas frederiksbergensis]
MSKSDSLRQVIELDDLKRVTDRVSGLYSHKGTRFNTLIGMPLQMARGEFYIPINIDERCELMGDHQTGQHVQGMLIIEAFRQSMLAVTDIFFPLVNGECNQYVLNMINTDFHHYLFPLPAHIKFSIIERRETRLRTRYRVSLEALQNELSCAAAEVSFTAHANQSVSGKEAELAASASEVCRFKQVAHELPINMLL